MGSLTFFKKYKYTFILLLLCSGTGWAGHPGAMQSADTLALTLDPYPRSPGAEATLKEAGVLTEAEAGPFAALAKLKRSDSEP